MDEALAREDYWFDAGPLLAGWDHPTLAKARSRWAEGSLKGRLSALRSANPKAIVTEWWKAANPIEAFAGANGFDYVGAASGLGRNRSGNARSEKPAQHDLPPLPGVVLGSEWHKKVLAWHGPPYVEFGQYGTQMTDDVDWGYVALRHGRDLPHLLLDARANDARPSSMSRPAQRLLEVDDGVTSLSEHGNIAMVRDKVAPLDLGAEAALHFRAYAEKGREADVRELLSAEAKSLIGETVQTFDVEIVDAWVFLYGYRIQVVAEEPETWAWVFSLASRWLDQMEAWSDSSVVEGASGTSSALAALPFYTRERRPRPSALDDYLPRPLPDATAVDKALWGDQKRGRDGLFGDLFGL